MPGRFSASNLFDHFLSGLAGFLQIGGELELFVCQFCGGGCPERIVIDAVVIILERVTGGRSGGI